MFFTGKTRAAEIEAREKVEHVIELLDLQHHRESMVAGLAYGVRKVVELARALCTEPQLLLLDEPSSGLNVEETDDMAFWITDIKNELGITVLMVEHDMSLVSKVSDRVLAMSMGEELASGTPAEVQAHPGVIEAYLGSVDDVSSLRRDNYKVTA
jgi:branched-chain amino acid transport system ATP-binding protein